MVYSDSGPLAANWKAMLVCPDREMGNELATLLTQFMPRSSVSNVQNYPTRSSLSEAMNGKGVNLCILDVTSDRERALAAIADLIATDPTLQIVALLKDNNPDLILRCLRQGAGEFLVHPFTLDQLRPALDRLARLHPDIGDAERTNAKVICVMPAKGACGASTIASNLAFQYKRLGFKKILLADLDPFTGTLSFLLKLKSNYSFLDALTRSSTLDADLWKAMVTPANGVDVLLAPETMMDGLNELRNAHPIIQFSRFAYEAVIIDTAGPYGEWNQELAQLADEVLLVTTNELPALQATQRALSHMERNNVSRSKVRLLVNRYHRDLGLSRDVIETALHIDVFHLLPSDYDSIQRALIEGKPIPANNGFGKGLVQLAERLAGREECLPAKKSSGFSSLLSLFSRTSS